MNDQFDREGWEALERYQLEQADKYRSVRQHFEQGEPWADTPLFQNIYRVRFANGETIRGCETWGDLERQYQSRVDGLFADMRRNGFRQDEPPIPVYIDAGGEILVGNQGNHRLAIAQVLRLPFVLVRIVADNRLLSFPVENILEIIPEETGPNLPESARTIPAMTTPAERLCYYRHAKALASQGAIVELGAWLGAATAYLAAGVRDSGEARVKVHTFDRFVWKPSSHDKKAGGRVDSQLEAFRGYLGDLLPYVEVHQSELKSIAWPHGRPVSLLVCDAPKRIPEISIVLSTFAEALKPGALMAWQDFAYFPSYDIPAALIRLGDRVEFVEAVYPGTTVVFRVRRSWTAAEVTPAALALNSWRADEIESAWDQWGERLPEPMRPRFACGAAMFLCDIGATDRALKRLAAIVAAHPDEVLPKWKYLREERAALMTRYRPLFEVLKQCA